MTFTKVTNTGIGSTGTVLLQNLDVIGIATAGFGVSTVDVFTTGITTFANATDSTSSTTGSVIVSGGVGIAGSLNVGGSVSVGGTLTYEDVTNVDSVGIITARSNILVGSGITLSPDGHAFVAGVSTIGTLSVSGIVTATGAVDSTTGTVTSSGNMTVGGKLIISGNGSVKDIEYGDGSTTGYFRSITNVNRSNADAAIHMEQFKWNNTKVAEIKVLTGDDTTNKDNAHIVFETAAAGTTGERLRIASDGKVGIGTNDPQAMLHVESGANSAILLGNTGHGYKLRANVTSANDYGFLIEDEDGVDLYKATSSTGTTNADTHIFSTAGTSRLEISASGFVTGNVNTPAWDSYQNPQQNIPTGDWTLITNLVEEFDSNGAFASSAFTVPAGGAGTYFIYGYVTIDDVQAADYVLCGISVNGGEPGLGRRGAMNTGGTSNVRMSSVVNIMATLSVGDVVRISALHNEGSTEPTEPYYTRFGGYRLCT